MELFKLMKKAGFLLSLAITAPQLLSANEADDLQKAERVLSWVFNSPPNHQSLRPVNACWTNKVFSAEIENTPYCIRIGHPDCKSLGINRLQELQIRKALAEKNIAPPVIFSDTTRGTLVSPRISMSEANKVNLSDKKELSKATKLLKRYHRMEWPSTIKATSPFDSLRLYYSYIEKKSIPVPEDLKSTLNEVLAFEALFSPEDYNTVCHGDLYGSNFVRDQENMYLVGWDYAGKAPLMYDLASFCMAQNYSFNQRKDFLSLYLDETPTLQNQAELEIFSIVYRMRETLWSYVQSEFYANTEEFHSWAESCFLDLKQLLNRPETSKYARILKMTTIKHTANIEEFFDHDDHSVLFIDIDDTLIYNPCHFGTDTWEKYACKYLEEKGLSSSQAFNKASDMWHDVQHYLPVTITDSRYLDLIQANKGQHLIIALTARLPRLENETISQLKQVGIDLSDHPFKETHSELQFDNGATFKEGILFCNGKNKGEVILNFLKAVGKEASHIAAIDDRLYNLEDISNILAETETFFKGYRYSGCDAHKASYDAALALQEWQEMHAQELLPNPSLLSEAWNDMDIYQLVR